MADIAQSTPDLNTGVNWMRRLLVTAIIAGGLAAVGWAGWHYWTVGRFIETTDDAYLAADNVVMAPKITGIITQVRVEENQQVHTGDLLVQIDDRDFQVALSLAKANLLAAEADLRTADAQISLQQSIIEQSAADLASNQASLQFSQQEQERYRQLMTNGNGTIQRAQQTESDLRARQASVTRSKASQEAAKKQLEAYRIAKDRAVATLAASRTRVEQAELDLEHTRITAPSDGVVGDKAARVGQYVQPGTRLMSIVPLQNVYLIANYKETQITHMREGMPVTLTIDTFPDRTINGTILSFAPGTGSQFSLLPPENATGNFTKIVQRVPVKIKLDPADPLVSRVRPGLSATVNIDTKTVYEADHYRADKR